eukprot:CFRG3866T1
MGRPNVVVANTWLVELFEEWLKEARTQGNRNKEFVLSKALSGVRKHTSVITCGGEARLVDGIGNVLANRIDTFIHKGKVNVNGEASGSFGNSVNSSGVTSESAATSQSSAAMPDVAPKKTGTKSVKVYFPTYRSGPWAIVRTIYEETQGESSLSKEDIITHGQKYCDASFTIAPAGSFHTAWSSTRTLLTKGILIKQGVPANFSLSMEGLELAELILLGENPQFQPKFATVEALHEIQKAARPKPKQNSRAKNMLPSELAPSSIRDTNADKQSNSGKRGKPVNKVCALADSGLVIQRKNAGLHPNMNDNDSCSTSHRENSPPATLLSGASIYPKASNTTKHSRANISARSSSFTPTKRARESSPLIIGVRQSPVKAKRKCTFPSRECPLTQATLTLDLDSPERIDFVYCNADGDEVPCKEMAFVGEHKKAFLIKVRSKEALKAIRRLSKLISDKTSARLTTKYIHTGACFAYFCDPSLAVPIVPKYPLALDSTSGVGQKCPTLIDADPTSQTSHQENVRLFTPSPMSQLNLSLSPPSSPEFAPLPRWNTEADPFASALSGSQEKLSDLVAACPAKKATPVFMDLTNDDESHVVPTTSLAVLEAYKDTTKNKISRCTAIPIEANANKMSSQSRPTKRGSQNDLVILSPKPRKTTAAHSVSIGNVDDSTGQSQPASHSQVNSCSSGQERRQVLVRQSADDDVDENIDSSSKVRSMFNSTSLHSAVKSHMVDSIQSQIELQHSRYSGGEPNIRTTSDVDSEQGSVGNGDTEKINLTLLKEEYDVCMILDNREMLGKKDRHYIQEKLQQNGVRVLVRAMQLGDFMWIAKKRTTLEESVTSVTTCKTNDFDSEIVIGYIGERKRMDDLSSSVIDGRFQEQLSRMRKCGLRHCMYLIESYGKIDSHTLPAASLESAIACIQVQNGLKVTRTENIDESIRFLTYFTKFLIDKHANKNVSTYPTPQNSSDTIGGLMVYSEYVKRNKKSQVLTVQLMFAKQLMCIKGMTAEKARAVVEVYPCVQSLVEAYSKCDSTDERRELLANIEYESGRLRTLGKKMSDTLYNLYCLKEYPVFVPQQ